MSPSTDLNEPFGIADFFIPPCDPSALPVHLRDTGRRPILHLLRRDLTQLYGDETDFGEHGFAVKAPVLASLGIFSGIDLMSKLSCPNELESQNGNRFKWAIEKYSVQQNDWHKRFLWELRNAVAHNYSMKLDSKEFSGTFRFSLNALPQDWIAVNGSIYTVYLFGLKDLFLAMIRKFQEALEQDSDLLELFTQRQKKCGIMRVPTDNLKQY